MVTEVIERDKDPVLITRDRVIEVPVIMEKIVDKITMMPQVVEVLKHIYELENHEDISHLCGIAIGEIWVKYRELITIL